MATTTENSTTRREDAKVASSERRARAEKLKGEMDPWVESLGGWNAHGMKTDLGQMAVHLAREEGAAPVDLNYVQASLTMLTTQGTMGDVAYDALVRVNDVFKNLPEREIRPKYVELVRAAMGHERPIVTQDWPFVVELIPISKLFADASYQRPIDAMFCRGLLLKFDERLVGTIDVSKRKGGKYAILDGQQRVETMRQIGKTHCWCSIYEMTVPEEAAFFYSKNRDRKNMAYFYAFRARLLSGDATAHMIDEIVRAAGFSLSTSGDSKDTIGAVRSIEEVYEMQTELWPNALAPTLELIRKCFYGRPQSFDAGLIRGIGRFFSHYGRKEIQWKHFEETLTGFGPGLVLGRARDAAESTKHLGGKMATEVAYQLGEIHNQGLPRGERLDLDRIPLPLRQRAKRRIKSAAEKS